MGNCFTCFTAKSRGNKTADGTQHCKYQVTQPPPVALTGSNSSGGSTGDGRTKFDESPLANHNNNYPMTAYPQRDARDALEASEVEGLLSGSGSVAQPTTVDADNSGSTDSGSLYGLKLLKKPKNNILKEQQQQQQQKPTASLSDNKINALFECYKDEEREDEILAAGIERLCCDLRYKPEDFAVLVLAWRLDASQMCRFTKTEFIQGLRALNADSIETVRQRVEEEVARLAGDADSEKFKSLYRFTFRFGLEPELRTLPLDMAISLWRLVFTVHTPEVLDKWLEYLAENPQQIRGIPKDTWNMFLNFAESCDIYSYSDEDAWPSVFDDFVEAERKKEKESKEAAALS